jgi:hypothetical protein
MIDTGKSQIGDVFEKETVQYICRECGCVIINSLCNYGCSYDDGESRPDGTRIKQVWAIRETLVIQEIV